MATFLLLFKVAPRANERTNAKAQLAAFPSHVRTYAPGTARDKPDTSTQMHPGYLLGKDRNFTLYAEPTAYQQRSYQGCKKCCGNGNRGEEDCELRLQVCVSKECERFARNGMRQT